jgi:hypothetical protein
MSFSIRYYTWKRKGALISALNNGEITRDQLIKDHNLTEEELREWESAFAQNGCAGLRQKVIFHNRRKKLLSVYNTSNGPSAKADDEHSILDY